MLRLILPGQSFDHILPSTALSFVYSSDGNRKLLSGKKMGAPGPFSIVGVYGRAHDFLRHWGCNIRCFVRFGGLIFDASRPVGGSTGLCLWQCCVTVSV